MTSHAAKRRARKASRKLVPVAPRKRATTVDATVRIEPAQAPKLRGKTGLEWLRSKRRLSQLQVRAGERYGRDYRMAATDGVVPIKSSIAHAGMTIDSSFCSSTTQPIERDGDAMAALLRARAALGWHAEMIAVCDVICGREHTPWDAIGEQGQKAVTRAETILSIALDLLVDHYATETERRREREMA